MIVIGPETTADLFFQLDWSSGQGATHRGFIRFFG